MEKYPATGIKRLFLDIETSPDLVFSWRTGYQIDVNYEGIVKERKIICVAYKWEHEKRGYVIQWDEDQDDRKLLIELATIMEQADEVVAHFGNGFDVPWIRTRVLLQKLPPLPLYKTIDTKALASKYFYFNSNKLDYISKVLGHGGKLKTDYQLWLDIIVNKSKKALDYMSRYCLVDVLKLEKVYKDIKPFVKPRTHEGVLSGDAKWTCPHCGSADVKLSKRRVTTNGTEQFQMRCNKCNGYFTISKAAYNAFSVRE